MKATILASVLALAFSITAFADAPGGQPPPLEQEPQQQEFQQPPLQQQPCMAQCQGGVYNQIPTKVCQVVPRGYVIDIYRFGRLLTRVPAQAIQGTLYHYQTTPDPDGRRICEIVR